MATLQELTVKIGADTDGLDKIDQAANRIDSNFEKVRDSGQKVTDTGKSLTAGLTTPIVGLGTAVLTTAASFETSMNGVRAVTGATGQDFDDLTDLARELGATTQFSASEAAAGMEFLGMAGWDTTEIMSGLPDVLNLAAAGGMELASAADIASNIMSGFGIEASEAARVSDVLAEASASANTSVEQLGGGFTYVGPVASSAGMSLEETAAILGVLADAGIQGEQGGTALRGALSQLLNPTAQVQGVMDGLGVSIQDADGAMRPFPDIMRDLEDAGADTSEMMQIFGQEAGPAMLALLERGADDVAEFTAQLEGSEGAAQEMADIRMEGLSGQLKELQSAAEGLMLELGDTGLLNIVTTVVEKFTEWTQKINETSPRLLQVAVVVAAVLAALGPLLIVVGMTITAIGQIGGALQAASGAFRAAAAAKGVLSAAFLASPITWIALAIIAAVAALAAAFVYAWRNSETFRDAVAGAFERVREAVGAVVDWFTDTVPGAFRDLWSSISEGTSGTGQMWAETWESIKDIFASVWEVIQAVWDNAGGKILGAIRIWGGLVSAVWSGLWTALPGVLSGAWTVISGVISGALGVISGILDVFIGLFTGDWQRLWGGLVSVVSGLWTAISSIFLGGIQAIGGLLQGLWGIISGIFQAIYDFLVGNSIVPDLVTAIIGWFQAMTGRISDALSAAWGVVTSVWTAISTAVSVAGAAVASAVSAMVSGVLGFFSSLGALPGMVGGFFMSMVSAAASAIGNLLSSVGRIPGQITSALGNLGNLLRNAGRNVIQGLINGITGMIGRVGSAMSNVASTIRSYLPFSPAEVGPMSGSGAPEVSGGRIAETLGEGIMSELNRIDRAADALMAPLDDRVHAMQNAAGRIPANVNSSASRVDGQEQRVVIDVSGADSEMKRMIRKWVRTDGRGDVQQAFGR